MATHDDLNTSVIAVVGFVGTIIVLAIILLLMIVFYQVQARQERERAEDVDKTYVEVSDLVARQQGRVADYGWVNQEKGIARIPVARAMDLVVADLARDPGASVTGMAEVAVEPSATKAAESPEETKVEPPDKEEETKVEPPDEKKEEEKNAP